MNDADLERFESKCAVEPNTGCWLWLAAPNHAGYGRLSIDGRMCMAHRLSYEHYRGAIEDGLVLDHLCRQRCCVNPDHLEAVTDRVNILRGEGPSAAFARRARCECGNEFVQRRRGSSARRCPLCDAAAVRLRRSLVVHLIATHCKRGHAFEGQPLRLHRGRLTRLCFVCKGLRDASYRSGRKAAVPRA